MEEFFRVSPGGSLGYGGRGRGTSPMCLEDKEHLIYTIIDTAAGMYLQEEMYEAALAAVKKKKPDPSSG